MTGARDRRLRRRRWLLGAAAAGGAGLLAAHGWRRLARPAPPDAPLSAEAEALYREAWRGLDPTRVVDCHVHVVGVGTGGSGCYVGPRMQSLLHPLRWARFDIYRRAAGVEDMTRADQAYVDTMLDRMRAFEPHGRYLVLAFDEVVREDGTVDREATELHVPNDWILRVVAASPKLLLACASVHPYRRDALAELDRVAARGARCIKWLPAAMRIDPSSPRCDPFYRRMAELGLPLLTHAGKEQAVEVEAAQALGNPLLLRRPLDAGVKVVVAHCATSGDDEDLDAPGTPKPRVASFSLFVRMALDGRWRGRLFGDLSAVTQYNRCQHVAELIARTDLGASLVNGSDYPLPGIHALLRTGELVARGLLDARERVLLDEIDRHNPLAFDFAVKRRLRAPSLGGEPTARAQLPDSAFMPTGLFPGVG
jgi:mannonate dehydratase